MRVTGGDLRGRTLKPFKWEGTKPSTDKVRQALFNTIGFGVDWSSKHVLDCFAGTGIVSLEFISRGAEVESVDSNKNCAKYMKNLKAEFSLNKWQIVKSDIELFLENCNQEFDIIFADPPYLLQNLAEFVDKVNNGNYLSKRGIFVLEHLTSREFKHPNRYLVKKYGDTTLSYFKKSE